MTDENIERLIDALNAHEMRDRIFLAALSEHVDFAKVWIGSVGNENSYDFFFIKSNDGTYVAAVLDMTRDLHVFVKETHRKQGHLCRAMKDVILPKLYQDGRKHQTVTFDNPGIGAYCERRWGFRVTGDKSAELDLSTFAAHPSIAAKGYNLSREDFSEIKVKINQARVCLTMVKEQLQVAYGDCDDVYLDQLISDIFPLDDDILALIESKQGILRK